MTDTTVDDPIIQPFPPLDDATEAALRASIERWGVLVPVIVDQDGRLLDGHHRRRIADELGIEYPRRTVGVADNDEALEVAETLNLDRRHVIDVAQRREIVAELRRQGHSLRAIGGAVGVDDKTVRNDLARTGAEGSAPDEIRGRDGKTYPSAPKPQPESLPYPDEDSVLDKLGAGATRGEARAIVDAVRQAHAGDVPVEALAEAVAEALGSRDPDVPAITKPDLGGGLSHPARFSDPLFEHFRELLEPCRGGKVLDPFAGTGRIHELRPQWETIGVELEPEWANLSEHTIVGNALHLDFPDEHFDAICTSPTYGNRLADHHDASDPAERRSYTHDLGRRLSPENSGAMQWGDSYQEFHELAWAEAVRVLAEGGAFVLNIKDHYRKDRWQDVAAWHVYTLGGLGLHIEAIRPVVTSHLRQGANGTKRVPAELVIAFGKGYS
jgi:ParB-like chromosome segregation protein Spo0J/SAM-dependent methyltransferase